ncbi:MAG: ABC transporter permease [Lachnospiraceae bacterium]|nr:ABC transporter permease [Lachnospiraceae bacterium]
MFKSIKNNREIIWSLAVNDFSTKYAGSIFGTFWAFVQPIITILIYACVFQYGLKSTSPVENVSYIYWFASGMIPWFFFSDTFRAVTNVLIEYSYLVKKVVFDVKTLPIIKIISSMFVHFFFIGLLFLIALAFHERITIYCIQVFYYLFCIIILVYAMGMLTSSIVPFFRDLGQIVNIVLDVMLWATPIIWSYSIVPYQFQWIIKLNPLFYIVEGYRDSFINKIWFFEKPIITLYYWGLMCILVFIGNIVFKKLRSQFADVL